METKRTEMGRERKPGRGTPKRERGFRLSAALALPLALLVLTVLTAAAPADYSYLTRAFRARNPYAVSRADDRGRSMTQCIDRGDYYELTNVSFFAYKKYDATDVRAAEPGETFRIDGKAYEVVDIGPQDADGYSEYTLERRDGYGEVTRAYLVPVNPGKNKKVYYIAEKRSSSDGSFDSAELYATGSIFVRKDAVVVSANAGPDGLKKVVSAEQYFTLDRGTLPSVAAGGVISSESAGDSGDTAADSAAVDSAAVDGTAGNAASSASSRSEELFQGGYSASENLYLVNGSFAMDENGYVVSFAEKPWELSTNGVR